MVQGSHRSSEKPEAKVAGGVRPPPSAAPDPHLLQGLGFRVGGLGLGFRVWGLGFGV